MITTTWLSKLTSDHYNIMDREGLHKYIWRAFDAPDGSKSPFLLRVEDTHVLVRSEAKPRWSNPTIQVRPERHAWAVGDTAFVSVHVTPWRRHGPAEIPSTKEQDYAFIVNRLTKAGLALAERDEEDDLEAAQAAVSIRRLWVDYTAKVRCPLNPLSVEGTVTVVDDVALSNAIKQGLGGRKQFLGFGMLILS